MNFLIRRLLGRNATCVGLTAFANFLHADRYLPTLPHFAPGAKRSIYLFQPGAPSQMELFDYKPNPASLPATELPDSIRMGERLTGMTFGQTSSHVARSLFKFAQHMQRGAWVSEPMRHTAKATGRLCFVRSTHTQAINHDPAVTFFQTSFQLASSPSVGAWMAYPLGNANQALPAFIVMISQGSDNPNGQPLPAAW